MRDVRFRVWDNEQKRYRTEKDGDYSLGVLSGHVRGIYGEKFPQMEVEQFTGLQDKNGVDIYEGDILDSSEKIPMIFEVYYQDGGFRYGTKDRSVDISFSGHNWLENILKRFHVIGSIHTTPELLNPSNK